MAKIIRYSLIVSLAVSAILFLLYFLGIVVDDCSIGIGEDVFIGWAYLLFALCTITSIVFPIIYMVHNFDKAKGALIGVGALAVIVGLSYLLADSTIPTFPGSDSFNITESISKNVGVGLWTMYFLGGLTIASVIYSEVSKMFKH